MIQAKIINKIEFPEITLQEDLERIAKNIIIPDIIAGIDNSMAINGGSLPANEPETIRRKMSNKQLVETGTLRSSLFYKSVGRNRVVISISSIRKKIGGYLQSGIETKRGIKQYRFFGISLDARDSAMLYMHNRIAELARGKRSK